MANIQAVLFDNTRYSEKTSKHWLEKHNFHPIKPVHITSNYLRYRMKTPNYNLHKYRIERIGHGISFIIEITPKS